MLAALIPESSVDQTRVIGRKATPSGQLAIVFVILDPGLPPDAAADKEDGDQDEEDSGGHPDNYRSHRVGFWLILKKMNAWLLVATNTKGNLESTAIKQLFVND